MKTVDEMLAKGVKFKVVAQPDPSVEVVVCCRVGDPWAVQIEVALELVCSGCGFAIYVQPESLRIAPNARLVCINCLVEKAPAP